MAAYSACVLSNAAIALLCTKTPLQRAPNRPNRLTVHKNRGLACTKLEARSADGGISSRDLSGIAGFRCAALALSDYALRGPSRGAERRGRLQASRENYFFRNPV